MLINFLDDVDKYLQYVGGTPGAIALTTIAAASAYYLASRPVPEKPLVPLDNQCPILEVCIVINYFILKYILVWVSNYLRQQNSN